MLKGVLNAPFSNREHQILEGFPLVPQVANGVPSFNKLIRGAVMACVVEVMMIESDHCTVCCAAKEHPMSSAREESKVFIVMICYFERATDPCSVLQLYHVYCLMNTPACVLLSVKILMV